jgi:hypothetical protein
MGYPFSPMRKGANYKKGSASMHKKLLTTLGAIVALAAFAIPSTASASPVLTESGFLAAGSSVLGTNTGNIVFSGSGLTEECKFVKFNGFVRENTGSSFTIEVPLNGFPLGGTGLGEDCTSNLGPASAAVNNRACLATVSKTDNLSVNGCGSEPFVFTLSITGTGVCKYSTTTVTGTFTTNADATVKVTNQAASKVEGGIFCPGTAVLNMDFDVTTPNGATILIS